jgi:hypothetical protein
MPLAIKNIVKNRINFKAVTIVFGIVIALVILFSLWFVNPQQPPVATDGAAEDLTSMFNLNQMRKMMLQAIF